MGRKVWILFVFLTIGLLASMFLSISMGSVKIGAGQFVAIIGDSLGVKLSDSTYSIAQKAVFWNIRLPRVLMSVVVGVALSLSGAALQGLFRNPLVDAGLIGISSGASFMASFYIVMAVTIPVLQLFSPDVMIAFFAFLGALAAVFMTYRISVYNGKSNITILILAGVALNAFCGSLTGLITYLANEQQLRDLTFWTMGSLSGSKWSNFLIVFPIVAVSAAIMFGLAKSLDGFALGESSAHYLGVNVQRLKALVIILSTLMVGATVAFTGVIGFVGLVVPHIVRSLIGPGHKNLLPVSALLGAIIVCIADLVSRTLNVPTEIPIGIITSFIGTPILIVMIFRQKRTLIA